MTQGGGYFIKHNGVIEVKYVEDGEARMTKALMPLSSRENKAGMWATGAGGMV